MLSLPVPEAVYENVVLKPSQFQKDMVSSLAGRAEAVRNRLVEPYQDNMLKITNDGRKLALDQRLVNDMLPDNENSKAAACVSRAFEIWEQTKEEKSAQIIFCDLSTPKGDGTFNVYEDVRDKLVEKGVPPEEIAFIHEATIFDGENFICRGMREMLFLQQMEDEPDAATELAVKIDCFSHDCDFILYHESVKSMDENVSEIAGAIRQGDTGHFTTWLANIIMGDATMEEMERAAELLEGLNDYKPLAKIEELEEQNYNMVDNVPNNGAGEKAQKEEIPSGRTMMPCGADKENKKPSGRASLKERLAQKQAIVSGKGNEPQEGKEKNHREI